MISTRQKIITELETKLKTVLVVNGFETDAGLNVFEWRDAPLQESELPGMVYRDMQDPITQSKTTHIHDLSIEIECFAAGSGVPTTLRKMIADVNKVLGETTTDGRVTFSALAIDVFPESEEMVVEQDSRRLMSAAIKFSIQYHTRKFDPFTQ